MAAAGEVPSGTGEDGRLSAPSALRNRDLIAAELRRLAPNQGRALELASGTGEHVIRFAAALPEVIWQPTEPDAARRASIAAWTRATGQPNIRAPQALDAASPGWAARWRRARGAVDFVLVVNLLHLIPDPQTLVVLAEMADVLAPGGVAAVYGPFLRNGQTTSPGDAAFHAQLQQQNPRIGYKDARVVTETWTGAGLMPLETVAMPANNLLIAGRKP